MELAEKLAVGDNVNWAGLGARDILRLEAGLCLYGNDISEHTTPIEAGLAWCISKYSQGLGKAGSITLVVITIGGRRRKEGGFMGSDVILSQLKNKPPRRRVGLLSHSGPPARGGALIMDREGEEVGHVTSGCPSPCLKTNIAMGYIPRALSKTGCKLQLKIRTSVVDAEIVKMPFVPHKYYS